jgi:hypothetical protein
MVNNMDVLCLDPSSGAILFCLMVGDLFAIFHDFCNLILPVIVVP